MEDGQIEMCSAVISFTMSSLKGKKSDLKGNILQTFLKQWNYEILTRTLWSLTKSDKIIVKTNGSYKKENTESLNIIYYVNISRINIKDTKYFLPKDSYSLEFTIYFLVQNTLKMNLSLMSWRKSWHTIYTKINHI